MGGGACKQWILALLLVFVLAGCSGKPSPSASEPETGVVVSSDGTGTTGSEPAKGTSGTTSAAKLVVTIVLPSTDLAIHQGHEIAIEATFIQKSGQVVRVTDANWTVELTSPTGEESHVIESSGLPGSFTLELDEVGQHVLTVDVVSKVFGVAELVTKLMAIPPAGCEPRGGDESFEAAQALAPVLVGPGAGEPGLSIHGDGTIYVQAVNRFFRSVDAGQTFVDLGGDGIQGHSDGDLVVDTSGRIHWVGLSLPATGSGAILYQTSADQGDTFTEPTDISAGGGRDRQWLDIRENGTLYASWRDTAGIVMRTSHDLGTTWGPKRVIAEETPLGPILHGPVPGHVYQPIAPFRSAAGATKEVIVSRSFNDGETWDHQVAATFVEGPSGAQNIANSLSIFPVLAIDRACTMYLVYSIEKATAGISLPEPLATFGVFMVKSTDFGESWSTPQLISPVDKVAVMPWIVAGAPGNIAVAWYENVLGMAHETVPDEWHVNLWLSGNADGAQPTGFFVRLTSEPNHLGTICPGGGACVAGGDRSLLDYFELAIAPGGQVRAVWAASTLGVGTGNSAQGTQVYFGGTQTSSLT